MSNKPKVGDVLYKVDRHGEIYTLTVKSVGTKYFYCDDWKSKPYSITTLRYESKEYSQFNEQLYRTEQEIIDLKEHSNLHRELRDTFSRLSSKAFTLDQLRQIKAIITPTNL